MLFSTEREAIQLIGEEHKRIAIQLKECENWLEVQNQSVPAIVGYILQADTQESTSQEELWNTIWPRFKDCQRAYQLTAYLKWLKEKCHLYSSSNTANGTPFASPDPQPDSRNNIFNHPLSLDEVKKWFVQLAENKSTNGKPFLTTGQVDQFIDRAFVGKTDLPKLTLNIAEGERDSVKKLFYLFFKRCTQDYAIEPTTQCKEKYVRLLTDNFSNYNYEIVFNTFNKPKNSNKKWDIPN
ncbi:hypothetical protein GCM10028805_43030 [Spirosoma harenae]